MSDPQSWVIIGVFSTAVLGGLTLVVTMLTRVIDAKFEAVNSRFDQLEGKIDSVEGRLTTRLDHLDADVQALANRVWGKDRE